MPEHRHDEHAVDASCTQVQKGLGGGFIIRIGISIGDTDDTSTIDRTIERSLSYGRARKQPSPLLELVRGEVVVGDRMNQLTVESVNSAVGRSAKTHRILHDGLEDWLGVRMGRADRSENLRGGRLPAERFGQFSITRLQFLEQAHILDRDDRLVREGLEQRDLLVCERLRLGASHYNRAQWHPFSEQWNTQVSPNAELPAKRRPFGKFVRGALDVIYVDSPSL